MSIPALRIANKVTRLRWVGREGPEKAKDKARTGRGGIERAGLVRVLACRHYRYCDASPKRGKHFESKTSASNSADTILKPVVTWLDECMLP